MRRALAVATLALLPVSVGGEILHDPSAARGPGGVEAAGGRAAVVDAG